MSRIGLKSVMWIRTNMLKNNQSNHEDKAKKRSFILRCCEASNPEVSVVSNT
jgi:hypothetical protein